MVLTLLHGQDKELSDLVIDSSVTLDRLNSAIDEFQGYYCTWSDTRNTTISMLNGLATDLDNCQRNVDIAEVTGSSVGAVGGALAIGGAIASIFTLRIGCTDSNRRYSNGCYWRCH